MAFNSPDMIPQVVLVVKRVRSRCRGAPQRAERMDQVGVRTDRDMMPRLCVRDPA